MCGANPPEAAGLCPTSLPFEVSKANASRRILEKSMELFANTRGLARTRRSQGGRRGESRFASAPAGGGPGIRPNAK